MRQSDLVTLVAVVVCLIPMAGCQAEVERGHESAHGAIMGAFQVLWVYYGLLIGSRPVILWNVIAVLINLGTVGPFAITCTGKGKVNLKQRNDC